MTRKLADSTVERFRKRLLEERAQLERKLEEHAREREEARLSESASERAVDPDNTEGGSMAFEMEKELSIDESIKDVLAKIERALARMDRGEYGICEECGGPIPVERLEALPHTTLCVSCAAKRRSR